MPSPGIAPLDELRLLVVVDNETDTLSSVAEGIPQVPEVAHLMSRVPTSREYNGHPCKVVFDRLCCAGHGLSVLVTGRSGDEEHTMLFDVGPYADLWKGNAARLGVELAGIEAVFLPWNTAIRPVSAIAWALLAPGECSTTQRPCPRPSAQIPRILAETSL